jgi:hypothetical protein
MVNIFPDLIRMKLIIFNKFVLTIFGTQLLKIINTIILLVSSVVCRSKYIKSKFFYLFLMK